MGRRRAGRKRSTGPRHPGGQLKRRAPQPDAEIHLQRAVRAGRLPPANRGLWEMGRPVEALKGTNVRRDVKEMQGPDVPPLRFKDAAETIDAVGRAWVAGLLGGREVDATVLRDRARGIAGLYWRHLQPRAAGSVSGLYRNVADECGSSGGARPVMLQSDIDERDRNQEAALLRIVRKADEQGQEARNAFDELVIDLNPDHGPPWLDRLLSGAPKSAADLRKLSKAVGCLMAVLR